MLKDFESEFTNKIRDTPLVESYTGNKMSNV
jgi:hypothetical protein